MCGKSLTLSLCILNQAAFESTVITCPTGFIVVEGLPGLKLGSCLGHLGSFGPECPVWLHALHFEIVVVLVVLTLLPGGV